ncbi:MAG: MBL fold metallo-hydrolase, partial [Gemmiger sp.]
MKLTFLGAAREVTGSCTLVETGGHRFLVDCGMEQGRDVYENAGLPCAPGEIEALLLTHAHIDHSGRIPYLYKNGFRGPVYTTDATADLCEIMLEDSAHIQEQEAEWKNRKAQRSGRDPVEPDYTVQDAVSVMTQFRPCRYEEKIEIFPGVTVVFTDVGHLLGSASITLRVTENGETQTIVFSGDIGNRNQPLIRDPHDLIRADYVVMESTYGDR